MSNFYYQSIIWDRRKSEIIFRGCYLGSKLSRFQIDGIKQVVFNKEKLYLCKIKIKTKKGYDELFKIFVIRPEDISNWNNDDIQLIGQNNNGQFVFDKEFEEGMRKVSETAPFIKLSDNEKQTDNRNTPATRLRKNQGNSEGNKL